MSLARWTREMTARSLQPDAPASLLIIEPGDYLQLRRRAVQRGNPEPKFIWDPQFDALQSMRRTYSWHLRREAKLLGPFEHRPRRVLDAFDVIDEEFSVVPSLVWSTDQLKAAVTNDGHIFDAIVCTDVPDVNIALGLLNAIAATVRERI